MTYKLKKFYAPWCAPCTAVGPNVLEAAQEMSLTLENINIDLDTDEATLFGIRSIPQLILVTVDNDTRAEHVVARLTGAHEMTKSKLIEFIKTHITV